ncbi:MAG TPA: protein kinase [Kofleriaceae bacterium]
MSVDAAAEEQFGPYLVYERLGVGGMATVHRALEQGAEGFERMVALKRLLPHLAEDASFIKSFVREAKLASILNHVNIVQIYELGRVGTEYFISMEYIDGRDLRRILRHARKVTGPPPIHIIVAVMIQLCEALDYAHNKVDEHGHPLGLVHRDISPSNVLVTSGGHVKIIDFGIAKAQSSQLRTQTGRVKGKLAYMAPEAVSGRDLDSRSDIWACGVILHELLTARPLFASKNEYQTLLKVQRGDIMPPSTFNQGCPPDLDAIVFRALARDPDDRYATASELREALLVLKRQYALHTGYREISGWLDWAFGLEVPQSFTHGPDSSGLSAQSAPNTPRMGRHKTPRPHRTTEEDEAVEVVWGGGNVESEDGPVVLEDVPDVSEKHVRPKHDTEDESSQIDDDIPTPLPSHGLMPSIYGAEHGARPQTKDPAIPAARGSDQLLAQRGTPSAPHTVPRGHTAPQQAQRGTGPQQPLRNTPLPRKTDPSILPPQRPGRSTSPGIVGAPKPQSDRMQAQHGSKSGPVPRADAPMISERMAAQRARAQSNSLQTQPNPVVQRSRTDTGNTTNPEAQRLRTDPDGMSAEDLFGVAAAEALAHISDDIETSTTGHGLAPIDEDDVPTIEPSQTPVTPVGALPPVPVVRFSRAQSVPPLNALADPNRPQPTTKPGIAPVAAITTPRTKPPSNIRIGETIAARGLAPKRTWLVVLGAILLAGGAAVAVASIMLSQGKDPDTQANTDGTTTAPTAPTKPGIVRFNLEPPDAEIRIGGQAVHSGSPWSSELAAGTHQIEIHRTGYKSWLTSIELSAAETQTLRVVLEPLTARSAEASLTITSTPEGLEVVIDGQVQAQRTPYKASLKPGAHTIALRQNGVEVWHQSLTAESSSDYEFNPSFTEDKQRERAQRIPSTVEPKAAPPAPTAPAPAQPSTPDPKVDHQDPSPAWIKGSGAVPTPTAVPAVIAPADKPPATPVTPPSTATTTTPSTATSPPTAAPAPAPAKPAPPAAPAPAPKQNITAPVTTAPAPAAPPKRTGPPPIVAPNAVKKLSGDPPSIEKFKNVELPALLTAKVCIDESGKVTSVDMVTKVTARVAGDITESLRRWRYAPYTLKGAASPACFVVTFRAK